MFNYHQIFILVNLTYIKLLMDPFSQFLETGAVDVLIENVFEKSGYQVHAWTKTPYICSGDRVTPYYVLYDAVFVLSCPSK